MNQPWLFAFILTLGMVLGAPSTFAQHQVLRRLTPDDGLSSSEVYDLHQDEDGILWFATSAGLCRYDGYSFHTLTSADGLDDDDIIKLFPFRSGAMWVGTYSDNLNLVGTDGIRSSRNDSVIKRFPKERVYRDFIQTGKGEYLALSFFMHAIDPATGKSRRYDSPFHSRPFLAAYPLSGGKARVFSALHEWEYHPDLDSLVPVREFPRRIQGVCKAPNQDLIFFGSNFIQVERRGVVQSYSTLELFHEPLTVLRVCSLKGGKLAFCTSRGAFVYADGDLSKPPLQRLAPQYSVSGVIEDREGLYWLSTLGDGVLLGASARIGSFTTEEGVPMALSLAEANDGRIWAVGDKGMLHVLSTNGARTIDLDLTEQALGGRERLLSISSDPAGRMWISGDACILRLNGEAVDSIVPIKGSKWISFGPSGQSFIAATRLFTTEAAQLIVKEGVGREFPLTDFVCTSMDWDAQGRPAVSGSQGIQRWDSEQSLLDYKPPQTILGGHILDFSHSGRHLWAIEKGKGLLLSAPDTLLAIGRGNGLSSQIGTCMAVRGPWECWLGTPMGLNRVELDPETYAAKVTIIDKGDGLSGNEVHDILICRDTIWVATAGGVSYFVPEEVESELVPVLLRPLQIVVADRDTLGEGPLDLSYDEAAIDIDWYASGFAGGRPPIYRFKMEGLDQDWRSTRELSVRYASIPPGEYVLHAYAESSKGARSRAVAIPITVAPPWWERTWAIPLLMLGSVLLTLGVLYLIYRSLNRRNRLELKVLMAEQKALRAQMNPHFLFNALNAIQGFFMRQKHVEGNKYLKMFSIMIRRILENSDKMWVPVEEELQVVASYMEFEQLRAGHRFSFEVDVAPEVQPATTEIPGMLIQPLLENAVWHGVRHKAGQGFISLRIRREDGALRVEVEDNGVGREQAAALANAQRKEHRSMGLYLVEERIAVAGKLKKAKLSLRIEDLKDAAGNASGTRALLSIVT